MESQESQDSTATVVEQDRHEVLYFAYGSNLSTAQMRARCPSSTPVGLAVLPGWRWSINARGYANALPPTHPCFPLAPPTTPAEGVHGLVYLLPPRDEASLDVHEGVRSGAYGKVRCKVRWVRDGEAGEGEEVEALVYVDEKRAEKGTPREEYVGRMEAGIEDAVRNWGMDEEYANKVMRTWWKTA
ncbi:AIG2 family protein [Cordyceps fumosorosea ARSEF 2679]|uniref:gamma-glutamylcyclotransferase n=1 Tax=Cordyceps fumosorosea (strain ARSEF 2679) TaxID=1081104 RepID=A0A162I7P6_CORFA|nr:AIG2 family protein [Cordyceps fumosorosea ARSEF 2679]OAA53435.1 AIG2 family protein [Cordyceps fumosorosea ARSEF 2679]